jgi:hypothetical protein
MTSCRLSTETIATSKALDRSARSTRSDMETFSARTRSMRAFVATGMCMDLVYIETSIISHATAWPSKDPVIAVLQGQARDWWSIERPKFEVVTSQLVLDEAALGDPSAAHARLAALAGIQLIPTDSNVEAIADELIARSLMPAKARLDALHVAIAAVGGVQFLLTQNCRHIANAHMLPRVYTLADLGYPKLLIYTPAEFLGNP